MRSFNFTPFVRNLLIVNILTYVVQISIASFTDWFSLHSFTSSHFRPYQFFTYMFLHSTQSAGHLLSNMLSLFIFGPVLEEFLGQKKFLTLYLVSGIGAGVLYSFINLYELNQMNEAANLYTKYPSPDSFLDFFQHYGQNFLSQVSDFANKFEANLTSQEYIQQSVNYVHQLTNAATDHPTVGASGAVFGILMAFGYLFPEKELFLILFPFPIKAKYFIAAYGLYEFYAGVMHRDSEIAHFAHIGGMLFAFLLLKWWRK